MKKEKIYHPNFINSQLIIAINKLTILESQYNNGSVAMRTLIYKKLLKARKLHNKWLILKNGKIVPKNELTLF